MSNGTLGLLRNWRSASPRAEDWRKVLARCQLDQIKALARSLAAETVDLSQTPAQESASGRCALGSAT